MRISVTIFFLILTYASVGQTKQDTINLLQNKAMLYLEKMYRNQNFDSAVKSWNEKMLAEAQDIYKKAGKGFLADTALYNQVKTDYKKFYSASSNFRLTRFEKSSLDKEGGNTVFYITYSFQETVDRKDIKTYSMIMFILDKNLEWKILDFRTLAILHKAVSSTK